MCQSEGEEIVKIIIGSIKCNKDILMIKYTKYNTYVSLTVRRKSKV